MELTKPSVSINPDALTFMFRHKREADRVFRDVIGLHNIDHIALTTISPKHELTFLSYTPALEHELLTRELWTYDGAYHPDFFKTRACKLWHELYHQDKYAELIQVKQHALYFRAGLSTTLSYKHCTLLLSFATKSKHPEAGERLIEHYPDLIQMGRYCFQNIAHVFMPYLSKTAALSTPTQARIVSPYMRLVVDNSPR